MSPDVARAIRWPVFLFYSGYTLRGHKRHVLIEKDAGGIKACSRWLRSPSDDTTGRRTDQQFLHPGRGASRIFFSHPNPEGAAALNHRLHTYDASGILLNAECVICDRPDYKAIKRRTLADMYQHHEPTTQASWAQWIVSQKNTLARRLAKFKASTGLNQAWILLLRRRATAAKTVDASAPKR